MVSSRLLTLVLATATAVNAAPFVVERDLNSTKWTPEHVLQPDQVILYGEDGRMEVVHESIYNALIESKGISFERPELDIDYLNSTVPLAQYGSTHDRRDCLSTNAVVTDKTETFVDWDVQMSQVVIGTGSGIDVSVAAGYSVSNSISVGAGGDLSLIKDKLKASFSIDYTRTWTTQTVITVKGTVQDGYSGVMITKPTITRRTGRSLQGCIGSQTQTGTFQADSHGDGSYAGVEWVAGAITLCTKKEYPLTRCTGSGTFV